MLALSKIDSGLAMLIASATKKSLFFFSVARLFQFSNITL